MTDQIQADDIIHFLNKYKETGELKHLEQAKVSVDSLWHFHKSRNVEQPSIQVITSKLIKQCPAKSDVYIKPTIRK